MDKELCLSALSTYDDLLKNKHICEGDCKAADDCPTGTCRNQSKQKLFKPRTKMLTKTMSSSLKVTAKSCPSSPSHKKPGNKPQSEEFNSNLKTTLSSQSLRYRSSPAGLSSYTGTLNLIFSFEILYNYFFNRCV